jgi:hypothetical protein
MAFSACLRSEFGRHFCPGAFSQSVSGTSAQQLEAPRFVARLTADIIKRDHRPRNFTNSLLALIPLNEDTEALIPLMCDRFENARLRWIHNSPQHFRQVQALSRAMRRVSARARAVLFLAEGRRDSQFASAKLRKKERT